MRSGRARPPSPEDRDQHLGDLWMSEQVKVSGPEIEGTTEVAPRGRWGAAGWDHAVAQGAVRSVPPVPPQGCDDGVMPHGSGGGVGSRRPDP